MPDYRATLTPRGGRGQTALTDLFGTGDIMNPLVTQHGLVFPYTPTIQVSGNADYEEYTFTHAIYKYNAYSRSYLSEIVLTCDFTSQTVEEARHTLACMHFFRTVTKSYFGRLNQNKAGVPPPIVNFNYLGEAMFNNVPVVIKNYTYVLPQDVDYIPVIPGTGPVEENATNKISYIPTAMTITITMDVNYNPREIANKFDLDDFRNGKLLKDGFI